MNNSFDHYKKLAELFYFPGEDYLKRVKDIAAILGLSYPELAEDFETFVRFASTKPIGDVQELYTRSFDVQSITTLDVGYVLFGDDYKRGALLVNLNRECTVAEIDCRGELPDFLPNVLTLLAKIKDFAIREEMVSRILAPALKKMIGEFDPNKIQSKNKVYKKHHKTVIETDEKFYTVFERPLKALLGILNLDFVVTTYNPPKQSADFLGEIGRELEIEKEQ